MLGSLELQQLKVRTKNVIEDTEYDFFHKTTAYYVLFQDSVKWVSANREDTGRAGQGECIGESAQGDMWPL